MAFQERFYCDVCGKEKGESGDWWLAWVDCYKAHDDAPEQPLLKLTRWERVLSHSAEVKHLCGAACAGTLMDRWMSAQHENQDESCATV